MTKNSDEHRLRLGLHVARAPATAGDLMVDVHRVLSLLRELHPQLLQGLKVYQGSDESPFAPLAADFSNLDEQALTQTARDWRETYPKLDFRTDAAGALLPEQALEKSMSLSIGRAGSRLAPDFFWLMVNAVPPATDLPGGDLEIRLDLPRIPEREFQDGAFLRHLFKQLIEANPGTECAWISNTMINLGTTCYDCYGVNLGWLTYVADPELAAHLPDGIKRERLAAGVLIDLQEAPPLADAPSLVAQAVRVRDALAPGGWLMTPRLRGLGHALPYKVYDPSYGGTPPA